MRNKEYDFTFQPNSETRIPPILKLNAAGMPVSWIAWKDAVVAAWTGKILWSMGEKVPLYGGYRADGSRSIYELDTIIACNDMSLKDLKQSPALSNRELFRRDQNLCLYCGNTLPP